MKKYMRYLAPILVSAIFVLAVYLLYNKLKVYTVAQIRACIEQIPTFRICLSLLLAATNYTILIGYDWLALKAIHKKLPFSKVSLVSFVGQTVSFNFGALLGGTSVRFRFYSLWGFSISDVVHLVLMLAVSFWIGAMGLCGIVFLISPPVFPPELLEKMPVKDVRFLGVILAAIAAAYLVLCCTVRKAVHVFGQTFVFPTPHIAVAQFAVSWLELVCAAACMWVLLPSDIGIGLLEFLPGFLMAQVAVVLTHIPGGVGIFELIILHLTHTPREQVVFAAVLIFRLIYYILPLLVAATVLALHELRQRRNLFHEAGRWLLVLSPTISSFLGFAAGAFLLVTSTFPNRPADVAWITQYVPAVLVPVGRFLCAGAGASLLFLSYGLQRRQRIPFCACVACLVLGIIGALLKGVSWPAALLALVVLLTLFSASHRFYRRSFFFEERIPPVWYLGAIAVLLFNFGMGWALYHTAWGQQALLDFNRPVGAAVVRAANLGIAVVLCLVVPTRMILRRKFLARKELMEKRQALAQAAQPPADGAAAAQEGGQPPARG